MRKLAIAALALILLCSAGVGAAQTGSQETRALSFGRNGYPTGGGALATLRKDFSYAGY